MKQLKLDITFNIYSYEELNGTDRKLIDKAREMTESSYVPYSHFHVGAAALLKSGIIVTGCNQENAAYPSGLCAERTALFSAGAQYPEQPVVALAISARNEKGFMKDPIPPCGACRQVILETEHRYNHAIRILLDGTDGIYEAHSITDLLPLTFTKESMD
jgi:cytidine deaminase